MPKKTPPLKAPSAESIQLLFTQAQAAPLQNLAHAQAVHQALMEVQAFFQALLADQISNSASVNGIPQASANSGGN